LKIFKHAQGGRFFVDTVYIAISVSLWIRFWMLHSNIIGVLSTFSVFLILNVRK